jgi:hypothetical protein
LSLGRHRATRRALGDLASGVNSVAMNHGLAHAFSHLNSPDTHEKSLLVCEWSVLTVCYSLFEWMVTIVTKIIVYRNILS